MIPPPPRGFDEREYRARTHAAQQQMADGGIDVLLLTTEPEVRYFTGFLTPFWQSPTRPFYVLVPASGEPVAVVPEIAAATMKATWLSDVRHWPSPRPHDEGLGLVLDVLVERVGPRATLGVPMGPETHVRMPMGDFRRLVGMLPGAWRTTDAGPLIRGLRQVKSPAEVEKIAHICELVSGVFDVLPEFVHAGLSEREAFRRFKIACLQAGVDDVGYLVGGAGPGGLADVISAPTDRPLSPGDLFMLDTGCTHEGYWCDFDRTYAVGPPAEAARRAYATLFVATEWGCEAARPGAAASEVYHAMAAALGPQAQGGGVGRLGHGLGMQLTEWPSIQPDDHTVLVPGMVLTLEPSLEIAPGRVMVQEENLVIAEEGPRWLTGRAPSDLPVL